MSDTGGFISVIIAMTQNDLRKLDSKLVIYKRGRPKTTGTSSIKCSGRTCKEGEFIFPNKRKRGKLILPSEISVTGDSAVQALVEFSIGEHEKLGTFEKEIKLFSKYLKYLHFYFFVDV